MPRDEHQTQGDDEAYHQYKTTTAIAMQQERQNQQRLASCKEKPQTYFETLDFLRIWQNYLPKIGIV